jgi:surfeit locus 1 family protein
MFLFALTVVGVALTARLGIWQLDRAAQKLAAQAAIAAVADLPPFTADDVASGKGEALNRRVQLQGEWVQGHSVYLDNRPMDGRVGFYVVTPLRLATGQAVLVQRGWAPRDASDRQHLPPVATPPGPVTVSGRWVASPSRLFELGAEAPGPIRQNLDPASFARELGVALLPLTVLQTGEESVAGSHDGLQRHWPAPDLGLQKHYGYAFQWFALCALILGLYVWFQFLRPWLARRHA